MNTDCGQQWFELAKVAIIVFGLIVALWLYIDKAIKMAANDHAARSNKLPARVKAAGCTAAFIFLQIPYAKSTLDFQLYGFSIQLYAVVNAGMLLAALWYGIITGGTFLTNIKGNGSSSSN